LTLPLSLSDDDKKLVVIDSFSDVVYFDKMVARLEDHGSTKSSGSLEVEEVVFDLDLESYGKQNAKNYYFYLTRIEMIMEKELWHQ
jgi:hypothetical protein